MPPGSVCRFFLMGKCRNGDNCNFKHIKPSDNPICEYFKRGECVYNNICAFRHEATPNSHKSSDDEDDDSVIQVTLEEIDVSNSKKRSKILCPFASSTYCPDFEKCEYIHGYPCEYCGKLTLHPKDKELAEEHITQCKLRIERDMDETFDLEASRKLKCSICMDKVLHARDTNTENENRFGLLDVCNHIFCLACIRLWRRKNNPDISKEIKRSCPLCRQISGFVIPSKYFPSTIEQKIKIIRSYKDKVSSVPCKYYDNGKRSCPFGNSCFYMHVDEKGRLMDRKVIPTVFKDEEGNIVDIKKSTLRDIITDSSLWP